MCVVCRYILGISLIVFSYHYTVLKKILQSNLIKKILILIIENVSFLACISNSNYISWKFISQDKMDLITSEYSAKKLALTSWNKWRWLVRFSKDNQLWLDVNAVLAEPFG